MENSRLSDEALVVRGGQSTPGVLAKSVVRYPSGIEGVAAASAGGKGFYDLCRMLPHSIVRSAKVGDIRSRGGDVIPWPGGSPFFAIIVRWEAMTLASANPSENVRKPPDLSEGIPSIFADFNNLNQRGNVKLNTFGTNDDLSRLGITLMEGLLLHLTDTEEFAVSARVRWGGDDGWIAVVEWPDQKRG